MKGLKSNFPHHDICTNVRWKTLEGKRRSDKLREKEREREKNGARLQRQRQRQRREVNPPV